MFCGLSVALSVMLIPPARGPPAVGVNVTLKLQPAPGANDAGSVPQVLVAAKSPALAPVSEMPVMFSVALPVFVSVLDIEPLVVPWFWLPNERLVAESVTTGACNRT